MSIAIVFSVIWILFSFRRITLLLNSEENGFQEIFMIGVFFISSLGLIIFILMQMYNDIIKTF